MTQKDNSLRPMTYFNMEVGGPQESERGIRQSSVIVAPLTLDL